MKKKLIFIAAGNSSRMGGDPKALFSIGKYPVLINTINLSEELFDDIYVITNYQNIDKFKRALFFYKKQAKVFKIHSGQGDADAILKALNSIQLEINTDFDATICWGDVYFTSSIIFRSILSWDQKLLKAAPIFVGCSVDKNPYAYFDVYTNSGDWTALKIKKSYFKNRDGEVAYGLHDQCIFRCISSLLINFLKEYQQNLGYDGLLYTNSERNEMGLLDSFDFMEGIGRPAQAVILPGGHAYSFNTKEELNLINEQLGL